MNKVDVKKLLRSKVNGDLYTLEVITGEPSGRIEVKHVASGKLFKWECLETFEEVRPVEVIPICCVCAKRIEETVCYSSTDNKSKWHVACDNGVTYQKALANRSVADELALYARAGGGK